MKINVKAKIHNTFKIELRNIKTGEIEQEGFAENIVLSNIYSNSSFGGTFGIGQNIAFGSGAGVLSAARTTLFNKLGTVGVEITEAVCNQPPLASYATRRGKLLSNEFVGSIFTEIGLTGATQLNNIFTHALIKDSEGNQISLGPKTDTQEVYFYSTVYFQPEFEDGITFAGSLDPTSNDFNGLLGWGLLYPGKSYLKEVGQCSWSINGLTNSGAGYILSNAPYVYEAPNKYKNVKRIDTSMFNTKIKSLLNIPTSNYSIDRIGRHGLFINLLTLAQNNSAIWSGHHFLNTLIGVGDGAKTVFNLPWDEARLDKPKIIYVDGIETAVTWTAGSVTFASPVGNLLEVTGGYWIDYIPKDINRVVDLTIIITFGEGAA